jgi:hypothetical protein
MRILFAAAAASAIALAGAAAAQPAPTDTPPAPPPPPAAADVTPAPAITPAPAPAPDTSGYNSRSVTDLATAKAGDTDIVSNGPVPDTRENRAKYGMPDSRAGKRTKPRGN